MEGNAIVYCQGAFDTPNGKTAHGLVRFTQRYRVLAVIDSNLAGKDAGMLLDGEANGIPILQDLNSALAAFRDTAFPPTHFVIGLAPDGGRIPQEALEVVRQAIRAGLHVDSGLHDFLSSYEDIRALAKAYKVNIRDIRKPPDRNELHFFSGKIEEVEAIKLAVLGTDSAIGKRTTAWLLVHALRRKGIRTELVGTGQTAWMQGATYSLIMDSLINDFVAGEIEHAVYNAWKQGGAKVIVIEGQGSLLNPAYPGGFEILAAARPDGIILQHAPNRKEYDGFPGYTLHDLDHQLKALEIISGKPVLAITLNHEGMDHAAIKAVATQIEAETNIPAIDVLLSGADVLADTLSPWLSTHLLVNHGYFAT